MKLIVKGTMGEKLHALRSLIQETQSEVHSRVGRDLLNDAQSSTALRALLEGVAESRKETLSFVVIHNNRAIDIQMPRDATVKQLKGEVRSLTSIVPSLQLLVGSEVLFHHNESLCRYGVLDGCQLSLVVMSEEEQTLAWKDGAGEDALFRKFGSCSNLRVMALRWLQQVFFSSVFVQGRV